MARTPETQALVRAVRSHTKRSVQTNGQRIVKALVRTIGPLAVELTGSDVVVKPPHLLLGAWPRMFDYTYGLKVGDTVLMTRLDDGDWYVIDVISEFDMDAGLDLPHRTSTGYVSGFGSIVGEVPVNDKNGAALGVVVVLDPATLHDFTDVDV